MKTLLEINELYKSDKGTVHSYLNFYESKFSSLRDKPINLLEIGVLFGNSLKLWHDYFPNGLIYGVDDFSQKDGHSYYNFKPVVGEEVKNSLSDYKRVQLLNFNCEDVNQINNHFFNLKFDIIIDDACHSEEQQLINYTNYSKFLTENGIYICEDIQKETKSDNLITHFKKITPNKNVAFYNFQIETREDDRLIFVF